MINVINMYIWIPIIIFMILFLIGILAPKIYKPLVFKIYHFLNWFNVRIKRFGLNRNGKNKDLVKVINAAGYSYDSVQDIFYSNMDAWQRNEGYCRLYDEAAAPFGMIIDCEPIYFEYTGKRWLIEFWKGQYDMCTGGEIGIYTTKGPDLNIPGVFNGTFYHSASDEERLNMSYTLKKNGKMLFTRSDRHWWLTGFKLGEFSEPFDLTMNITITLKDLQMCKLFVNGLKEAGYQENEYHVNINSVSLKFNKPHSPQPITRNNKFDEFIQIKNKLLCDEYNEITSPYNNIDDKMRAIKTQNPELFDKTVNIGKTKLLFYERHKVKNLIE